jgi:hypothetical protein
MEKKRNVYFHHHIQEKDESNIGTERRIQTIHLCKETQKKTAEITMLATMC